MRTFSSCSEQRLLFVVMCRLLIAEYKLLLLQSTGFILGVWASVVAACRLSCPIACRTFLDKQ